MTLENVQAGSSTEATSIVQKTLKLDVENISDVIESVPSPGRIISSNNEDEAQSEGSRRLFTMQVNFSQQAKLDESIEAI